MQICLWLATFGSEAGTLDCFRELIDKEVNVSNDEVDIKVSVHAAALARIMVSDTSVSCADNSVKVLRCRLLGMSLVQVSKCECGKSYEEWCL